MANQPTQYTDIRFLVVDDMATMRKIVSTHLRGLGATKIVEAADGNLAKAVLEKAVETKEPVQFIVCDWNMPNFSGMDLLKWCRANPNYSKVAFLLVTAESEMTQVSEAIGAGVDNYVVKPFTPASLAGKLGTVYTKRFGKKA